jgi:hypothetical protein
LIDGELRGFELPSHDVFLRYDQTQDAFYQNDPREEYGLAHDEYGLPHEEYGVPHEEYGPPHEEYGPPIVKEAPTTEQ